MSETKFCTVPGCDVELATPESLASGRCCDCRDMGRGGCTGCASRDADLAAARKRIEGLEAECEKQRGRADGAERALACLREMGNPETLCICVESRFNRKCPVHNPPEGLRQRREDIARMIELGNCVEKQRLRAETAERLLAEFLPVVKAAEVVLTEQDRLDRNNYVEFHEQRERTEGAKAACSCALAALSPAARKAMEGQR